MFQTKEQDKNTEEELSKVELSNLPDKEFMAMTIKMLRGTSLVVQWLRIHLPMQGTRVRAVVREDPICCGATKPVYHS